VSELTLVIKIIDLIPTEALTALNGASILWKYYDFHSLPQHSAILTLTPRKVAPEEGNWKEKCENNSNIILKFSTPCYTETTKMKFVYFVENLTATGSYRYGTTASNVLNGFSRTAVSQRLQPMLSVSFLHKIKSIMCEFLGKCYRRARPNISGNFVFCFTLLLIFLSSLMYTSACSLINVTRYWYKLVLIPQ
jgi:hypothetical protein